MPCDKRLHAAPEEGRRRAIGRYHDACTLALKYNLPNISQSLLCGQAARAPRGFFRQIQRPSLTTSC